MEQVKSGRMKAKRIVVKVPAFAGICGTLDKSLLSPKYAASCYNYSFRDGAIRSDIGFDWAEGAEIGNASATHRLPLITPNTISQVHFYSRYDRVNSRRDDRIIIADSEGNPYWTKLFESSARWTALDGADFVGKSCSVNYNYNNADIIIMSSENGSTFTVDDTTVSVLTNAPRFSSLTKHYERVYGSVSGDRNRVWFSQYLNPTDWNVSGDGAGYLEFNDEGGAVLKVVSFLSYLFIFREREILKLRAYSDQSDFTLSKVFSTAGRIFADTIAVCGDQVIFYALDGLYSMNGESATRILPDAQPFLETANQDYSTAAYYNGKYYLAAKIVFVPVGLDCETGNEKNNALIEYDLETRVFCISRGIDIIHMLPVEADVISKLFMIFRYGRTRGVAMLVNRFKWFEGFLDCGLMWRSGELDFGYPSQRKVLREVRFDSTYRTNFILYFHHSKGIAEYHYRSMSGRQVLNINRPFEEMSFSFTSENVYSANITNLQLTIDVL